MMIIDVLTIFPEYLAPLQLSLVGKAQLNGLLSVRTHDLRNWTTDRHRSVDDTPVGGGAGMVMRADIWGKALDDVLQPDSTIVVPTPAGEVFSQHTAQELATSDHLVFACGRYEGIDARVAEHYLAAGYRVREVSIGDYVLNGGEVAVMVMVEAIARLIPGMVGNPHSLVEESHGSAGLLEYPVYTRPVEWQGRGIPPVLLSGHHAKIERWRRDQAVRRTWQRRPDLIFKLHRADRLDERDYDVLKSEGFTGTESIG